ncbi:MAG: xanthine dehydrogenase family protein molybdopterin-binding subunit [Candidatus Eiseniibacteriota bacterium]|jgi:xanthine dehydrogenase YagR molybdenum-binding subunit
MSASRPPSGPTLDDNALYYEDGDLPETPPPSSAPAPWEATTIVGDPLPRVDGHERLSGAAVFPSDVVLPGMLHAAILRCPHAAARVKRIDASRARRMPGVRAILTDDSPEADLRWYYSRTVSTRLLDPRCRHEGEEVAAVAAESPYLARDALRAIEVEYEVLPFVVDERAALDDDAPRVHDGDGETGSDDGNGAAGDRHANLVGAPEVHERGDVARGFAEADVILERRYATACELHTPLELHGCVARWDGDRLTLWESTQGVYRVQRFVAWMLGLSLADVRVIGHYVGGGFGSKLVAGKYTLIAALLARMAGRPVKLFLSREETFLCVGNRPPAHMRVKAGVKRDGTLTALEFSGLGASGAYPAGGASLLDWQVRDLYTCPNVRTETRDVYVNAGPARPFRAPGHPQCSWALEQLLDELAREIDLDPVELRLRNIPDHSQADEAGRPYTTTGLRACLEEGARAFDWPRVDRRTGPEHLRRGVGMAACQWFAGAGGPPSSILVKLFADGSASLNMGASDIGTGTKTVMAMVVAEELGIAPGRIRIEHADTGTTQYATPSGGSKTVPTEAPAVRDACLDLKHQLLELAAEQLDVPREALDLRSGRVVVDGDAERTLAFTDIELLQRRQVLIGTGYRGPNPEHAVTRPFAAQFCEVEVDTRTGEVRVVRFLGAHESGRVMNRLTFDSQVIGGITMGIGLALTEERVLDPTTGKMVNANWHAYRLPTALDVPTTIDSVPIDRPDAGANTAGAKGLGEPVTIPTAAAVANAIHDAVGVRVTMSPASPARLLALLGDRAGDGPGKEG